MFSTHPLRGCAEATDLNATVACKGSFQESHSNATVADVMPSGNPVFSNEALRGLIHGLQAADIYIRAVVTQLAVHLHCPSQVWYALLVCLLAMQHKIAVQACTAASGVPMQDLACCAGFATEMHAQWVSR